MHFLVLLLVLWATVPISRAADSPQTVARVGFVSPQSPDTALRSINAFWERMRELGWVKGENLITEERWADGRIDRLPALMSEVLARKVDVLVTHSTPGAIAAKNATSTVPIVAATMSDPIRSGLTTSLAHPGGNLTGLSLGFDKALAGKWLELLQEMVPRLSTVAVMESSDNPIARDLANELKVIAPTRGLKVRLIEVPRAETLETAFEQAGQRAQAVLVLPDPIIYSAQRRKVTALAAKHHLPTIYYLRDFVDAGGLIAYAPDFAVVFRRAAEYADKILRGTKPGDLPVEQPTQFELVVNLKTAKALGISIPESILLRADEVIR